MKLESFVESRRPKWEALRAATKQASKSRFRRMSVDDVTNMEKLYRDVSNDLAIARRDFPDESITLYLNDICVRAYSLLNRGEPPRAADIPNFFRRSFPQTFRRQLPMFWLSLAISVVSGVAGWIAVYTRPDLRDELVPSSLFDQLAKGDHPAVPPSSFTSSFVITNNIKVDLLLFAGGVFAGTLTTYALIQNGWMLGTIAAAVHIGHYDGLFWSYIVPHGAIELSVILISGAAGLSLARAEFFPGLRSRADALSAAATDAVRLALGVAALLVVAGIFEGFVSPSALPLPVKYAIGALNFIWLYLWLIRGGRSRKQRTTLSLDHAA